MPKCPECDEPGAYIGFNSIECSNKKCIHYKIDMAQKCSCCGDLGHTYVSCPKSFGENYDDSGGNDPKYLSQPPDCQCDGCCP